MLLNLACSSPVSSVCRSIALNRVDFADLGLEYRFYAAPSFSSIGPALGASNGGVRVTIRGLGFSRFSGLAEFAACRWGSGEHMTVPLSLTDEEIICESARRDDLSANANNTRQQQTSEGLFVALNAVDFTWTQEVFEYFSESVSNLTVGTGPAGMCWPDWSERV